MNQEEDKKYPVFIGIVLFFVIIGLYFIYSLLFGDTQSGIFNSFLTDAVEEPTKIENVNLEKDIFVKDQFNEMELSEGYQFDINNVAVGKKNPFEANLGKVEIRK